MDNKDFEDVLDDATSFFRHQRLKDRWYNFCSQYELPHEWATGVYYLIQKFYQLPLGYRHYHTLHGHIYDCLVEMDKFRELNPDFTRYWFEVEFAIWFHDIFYVPGSERNEAESAGLAESLVFGQNFSGERIEHLIIATKTSLPPRNYIHEGEPELLICDIDLVGMGGSWKQFYQNGELVRKEFKDIPLNLFTEGRRKFFEHLYERGYVYRLPYFRERYERNARGNIKAYLEQ
jgi:predicted metal-dependent HD superfamily phosphohydrolase